MLLAAYPDDVGRVATAGAFGVEGVDRAAFIAANVVSTKPLSLSVSVWMITWTSMSSATPRQQSIAAGVVPQSSCSLSAQAPASTISTSAPG